MTGGRYLHDVQVKDGLLYAGYWRDGLVILDVGNGIKGGSPASPKLVSQIRFNYHELYGPGWLAGAHAVFRYKNYVFVGDEVFPAQFNLAARDVIPVKGIVHIVDVSDIEHPKKVGVYEVPEGGAHNMWVEDDVMYMGYYSAGARVVDVSGELRGDLYRQGREIARLWTGDPKGFRPNAPFTWGAQPHKGLIYFNDINSGVWITRLRLSAAPPPAAPATRYLGHHIDAAGLRRHVGGRDDAQRRQVQHFDGAGLGGDAFDRDERVAVVGAHHHAVHDAALRRHPRQLRSRGDVDHRDRLPAAVGGQQAPAVVRRRRGCRRPGPAGIRRTSVHVSTSISTISLDPLHATNTRRPSVDGCAQVGEHAVLPGRRRLGAVPAVRGVRRGGSCHRRARGRRARCPW